MIAGEIIRKKRDGGCLTEKELRFLLDGFLAGSIHDYQMSAWMMAVFFRGLNPDETRTWARLMWKSGVTFPRTHRNDFWVDKHSTGGVGDKTSLLLVPLVHCVAERVLGPGQVRIPMVSGRGLDFSGGTLDKLDSVAGFSSALTIERAMERLAQNGFFMMGQTEDLAPADRLLYALRDVTGTTDCIALIVSSILSKKLAENLDALVFDVKFGLGAFMPTIEKGRELARALIGVAQAEGVQARAVLTPMHEPLGWNVGNALEVDECADFLSGKQERGLKEVTLTLASEMLVLAARGKISVARAWEECEQELKAGSARKVFEKMFTNQGGDWGAFERDRARREGLPRLEVRAQKSGFVSRVDALAIAKLVRSLGGGRMTKTSKIQPDVGVVVRKKIGDRVTLGETVFDVVGSRELTNQDQAQFFSVDEQAVPPTRWCEEVVDV